jgi:hypothetical protein
LGIIDRIKKAVEIRRARSSGEKVGAEMAREMESDWEALKEQALASDFEPSALRALFLGWMHGLHAHLRDTFGAVGMPEDEFRRIWYSAAIRFSGRFHSEVLSLIRIEDTEAILSAEDVARIAADIDGLVDDLHAQIEADRDAAVELMLKGVREAEAAGTLGPDPRSDEELKASIRQMMEDMSADDLSEEEGQ